MWKNNTGDIVFENDSKTWSNSSILKSGEHVLYAEDVSIDASVSVEKTGIFKKMYHSKLKDYIPFFVCKTYIETPAKQQRYTQHSYMDQNDARRKNADIYACISKDTNDVRRNYKYIYLKKGSLAPLFENQYVYGEKFKELWLKDDKRLVNNLENAMQRYEDLKICLLIDNAKDNGELAFKITISCFSWIMEVLNLSFNDVEMFAASTETKLKNEDDYRKWHNFEKWHNCRRFCAFAFEENAEPEYFLKSSNKSEKESQTYHVVFHVKNFSELEVTFA